MHGPWSGPRETEGEEGGGREPDEATGQIPVGSSAGAPICICRIGFGFVFSFVIPPPPQRNNFNFGQVDATNIIGTPKVGEYHPMGIIGDLLLLPIMQLFEFLLSGPFPVAQAYRGLSSARARVCQKSALWPIFYSSPLVPFFHLIYRGIYRPTRQAGCHRDQVAAGLGEGFVVPARAWPRQGWECGVPVGLE